MIQEEIYPLFSSPVLKLIVDEDFSDFEREVRGLEFQETETEGSYCQDISIDRYILNKFPREKGIFLELFDTYYKHNILKSSNSFQITTSWATRTIRGSYGQYHQHLNSMYSGVFYFDDAETEIRFESYNLQPSQLDLSDPYDWNIFNSKTWAFTPKKNQLLIFPSYLFHKITKNYRDPERISLAFNLFPTGRFGAMDSTITLQTQS